MQADGAWGKEAACDLSSQQVKRSAALRGASSTTVAGVVPQYGNGDDGGPARRAVPTELYLVRYQYAGESDEWLYLGDGHHGLDVSPETAQRLRWAIGRLMDDE